MPTNNISLLRDIRKEANNCVVAICLLSTIGLSFRAFLASNTPDLYLNDHIPLYSPMHYLSYDLLIYSVSIIYTSIIFRLRIFAPLLYSLSKIYLSLFRSTYTLGSFIPQSVTLLIALMMPVLIYGYWNMQPSVYRDLSLSIVSLTATIAVFWRPRLFSSSRFSAIFRIYHILCAGMLAFITGRQLFIVFFLCLAVSISREFILPQNPLVIPKSFARSILLIIIAITFTLIVFFARTFNRDLTSFSFQNTTLSGLDILYALSFTFSMHDSEVFLRDHSIKGNILHLLEQILILIPRDIFPDKPIIYGISLRISDYIYSNSIQGLVLDFDQGTTSAGLAGTLYYLFGNYAVVGAVLVPFILMPIIPLISILKTMNYPIALYIFLSTMWQFVFRGIEVMFPIIILVSSLYLSNLLSPRRTSSIK